MSADLPRIEVIHDLPEHELTCACGCRKHVISEETSEQLDIVPMQVRVIKHTGTVRQRCQGKLLSHPGVGGVYGSHSNEQWLNKYGWPVSLLNTSRHYSA